MFCQHLKDRIEEFGVRANVTTQEWGRLANLATKLRRPAHDRELHGMRDSMRSAESR